MYQFRKMNSSDLSIMIELEKNSRIQEPEVFNEFNEESFSLDFKNNPIEDYSLNEVILCIKDNMVIGRVDLIVEQSFMDYEKIGYVDWVYVLKLHRKKGIAKKLFNEAETYFTEHMCKLYYLFVATNEEAKGFYSSINVEINSIDRASKKLK